MKVKELMEHYYFTHWLWLIRYFIVIIIWPKGIRHSHKLNSLIYNSIRLQTNERERLPSLQLNE